MFRCATHHLQGERRIILNSRIYIAGIFRNKQAQTQFHTRDYLKLQFAVFVANFFSIKVAHCHQEGHKMCDFRLPSWFKLSLRSLNALRRSDW